MKQQRVYQDKERVEIHHNGEWLRAMVFGFGERDGIWKYYVQRSGRFPPCDINDPTCWYASDDIRASA